MRRTRRARPWRSARAPCCSRAAQFGGLNSLDMPGTAGHGKGSYTITVELPDVATLPQNSPVMVDDVTVGSVSGIEAVQRPDGTFFAAVKLSLDGNVDLPANATAKVAQTSLLGSQHVELAAPVDERRSRAGWPTVPTSRWRRPAATRPPRKCCRRWAWW